MHPTLGDDNPDDNRSGPSRSQPQLFRDIHHIVAEEPSTAAQRQQSSDLKRTEKHAINTPSGQIRRALSPFDRT